MTTPYRLFVGGPADGQSLTVLHDTVRFPTLEPARIHQAQGPPPSSEEFSEVIYRSFRFRIDGQDFYVYGLADDTPAGVMAQLIDQYQSETTGLM